MTLFRQVVAYRYTKKKAGVHGTLFTIIANELIVKNQIINCL